MFFLDTPLFARTAATTALRHYRPGLKQHLVPRLQEEKISGL
jgi:hypothetical protein